MNRDLSAYGFVPTEYVSLGGHGYATIRRCASGWRVFVYRSDNYEHAITPEPVESYEKALAAYDAWVQAPEWKEF